MSALRFVLRSLAFHARAHAAALFGALVASTVLTGALALGDSVRFSLAAAAHERVGGVAALLGNGERFFTPELGARLEGASEGLVAASAIQLPAVVATNDGGRRALDAQLLGIERGFFALAPRPFQGEPAAEEAWVGSELARQLGIESGSELVLRVPKPTRTSLELALTPVEEPLQILRVRVARVLTSEEFGAFALVAGASPPANLFVQRAWLAQRLGVAAGANRVFLGGASARLGPALESALRASWTLADVGLAWREAPGCRALVSDQVFLERSLAEACARLDPPPLAVLTYFVNALEYTSGDATRTTPYSTVAALGSLDGSSAPDFGAWRATLGPPSAREIVLNAWTAEDLGVARGDEVRLRYFALGAGRRLEERTQEFQVRAVIPTEGLGADPSLAPDLPGIGDAENCRDWEPGLPIELAELRERDEAYWDAYRAAPKAFIALEAARELWGNRYGELTALRVAPEQVAAAEARLREVDPSTLGLALAPLEASALESSDFGGLFLGLSFFLIASALILVALFFGFALERRAGELGILRVCGLAPLEVARLVLAEVAWVCALGALLGLPLGLGLTRALLWKLEGAWSGAVGRTALRFAFEGETLVLAFALALTLALAAIAWVLWRARRARPLALLAGELAGTDGRRAPKRGDALCAAGSGLAALLALFAAEDSGARGALAFLAGLLVLVGGLFALRWRLACAARAGSVQALGWSQAARRPGRSLALAAALASSVFLLVVAGVNRAGPAPRVGARDAGTGGFALLARTNLPVLHDLRTAAGREFYGLAESEFDDVTLVALRARAGDEASCLNLAQPLQPRLLGVSSAALRGRFRFAEQLAPAEDPWSALDRELEDGVVPAVVDAVSLQWTLKKRLGDEIELRDARGQACRARVVATLADSILQGDVLISEANFERLFPSEAGHRVFWIVVEEARAEALRARLSRALADEGWSALPSAERLDLLHGVQNTYLAIFQALGGLGLVLGSAGLLALVLQSAVERRAELALLRVVGFSRLELCRLFLGEQGRLAGIGLGLGTLAGLCTALAQPQGASTTVLVPLFLWLLAVAGTSIVWVALGGWVGLRGAPREALAHE